MCHQGPLCRRRPGRRRHRPDTQRNPMSASGPVAVTTLSAMKWGQPLCLNGALSFEGGRVLCWLCFQRLLFRVDFRICGRGARATFLGRAVSWCLKGFRPFPARGEPSLRDARQPEPRAGAPPPKRLRRGLPRSSALRSRWPVLQPPRTLRAAVRGSGPGPACADRADLGTHASTRRRADAHRVPDTHGKPERLRGQTRTDVSASRAGSGGQGS